VFQRSAAFDFAHRLADKYEDRAHEIAAKIEPDALRRLFRYLVDTVLERPAEAVAPPLSMVPAMADSAFAGP
jgi:hypothetical protein